MTRSMIFLLAGLAAGAASLAACEDASPGFSTGDDDGNGTDTGADSDSDSDGDSDADGDSDGDSDADGDTDTGPIEPDCSNCPSVGTALENMACAVDLCDPAVLTGQEYTSPTNAKTQGTYAAVEHFGDPSNDLEPLYNGSYALMASGTATGTNHSVGMGGGQQADPFSKQANGPIYDVMEWRLHLKAPAGAHGFQILYVFFSEEYDDFVGTSYNDKFYIFIEAPSTNGGKRTVINFTECRNPTKYKDFVCDGATMDYCDDGKAYCYVAINTALSECCWYNQCPQGKWTTNIAGTGYSCAASSANDGMTKGSSTGWLKTEWSVEPEEEFDVVFHIHDTSDHIYDSEAIIDQFLFLGKADPGTVPVE